MVLLPVGLQYKEAQFIKGLIRAVVTHVAIPVLMLMSYLLILVHLGLVAKWNAPPLLQLLIPLHNHKSGIEFNNFNQGLRQSAFYIPH